MTARIARLTALAVVCALVALTLAPTTALAQWRSPQPDKLGLAASWAYSGNDTGYRLELGQQNFAVNAGFFESENYGARGDGDVVALELAVSPAMLMPGYEGNPFVVGVGGYRFSPDDPNEDEDDSFSLWLGAGDFQHSTKGLFYQYRYILEGPISGSQGILGWAF